MTNKTKKIASFTLYTFSLLFVISLVAARAYNSEKSIINSYIFRATHDNPVDQFGLRITYNERMIYTIDKDSITFHYPNQYPIGIVYIMKSGPISYKRLVEIRKEDSDFILNSITILQEKPNLIAHSTSNNTTNNTTKISYALLEDGIYITYIGPPENYHLFESTLKSATFSKHTEEQPSKNN